MSDLARLHLRSDDEQILCELGFVSLSSIAIASRYDLGFSKQKGDRLINMAQSIILNDHIQKIEVLKKKVRVFVNKFNKTIQHCIMDQFGCWDQGNYDKNHIAEVVIENQTDGYYQFALTKARMYHTQKWVVKIEAKQREERKKKGITMNVTKIKSFASGLKFDGFWEKVFQEIKGNDIMKKCLTLALFSTFDEPCHICILGDPGSSKTLSYDLLVRYFPDIVPIGANTTRSGLVINLGTGELGALATANQRVVVADEFDKIPKSDIPYTYELLSNGKCRVDSARVHETIESHFILIALGNPKSQVFGNYPIDQIGLPPTLMSRFALIIRTERLDEEERKDLFKQKFYRNFERLENPEKYVQWVRLARTFYPPIKVTQPLVEDYIESITKIINGYYHSPLRRDLRMGDYIRRIPFSIARAEFSPITEKTLSISKQIIQESINTWRRS